ncbi:beta-lactamase family protein [Lysobacter sp. BMK333-48F3]|uniref:serine hydrolase domain-containing protein n=1 Tax=Lysobacter sp. BMK333-48F3 TaxID=2867962 RepID=UPI001C8B4264|nr:serine hydrolase domain-containing protein [Lysobacter sp. BMK333-48F3]MBX9400447.1 beta-lactamase family protein [Lysobacter sp. BMK333-48F3]
MRTLILSIAAATLAACSTPSSRNAAAPSSGRDAAVAALMHDYAGRLPGASVLVLHEGRPLLRRGYGLADLETGAAATPDTHYRLASISKQFTAAAVLLLIQDGKLGLDDPVKRWLPSLPPACDAITIRQVLSHTSGLIDYEDVMPPGRYDDGERQMRDADVLQVLESQDRTYFAPGQGYRYSNSGYALLALIVEKASGQGYAVFLRDRIFLPLGMREAVAYERGVSEVAQRAYGYSLEQGRWRRTDQSPTSAVLGDGGIYASIDDLAKWDAALYDDRLLSAASRQLAFAPHTPTDQAEVEYGYGWRITGETLWHSGESIGFRNVFVRWPQRRLSVAVLSNRNDPEPYRLALKIAELYLPGAPIH